MNQDPSVWGLGAVDTKESTQTIGEHSHQNVDHVHQGPVTQPYTGPVEPIEANPATAVETPAPTEPTTQNYSDENVYRDPTKWSARQMPMALLVCTADDLARINEGVKQGTVSETTSGLEWMYWLAQAIEHKQNTRFGSHSLNDPEGFFVKRIQSELGTAIGAKNVGIDNSSETLNAASAKHLLRNMIGSGATRRWPLYKSGFWLTLSTPLEEDLLALDDRIAEEKTALGAKTAGLAFSVSMVYIFKHVLNLITTSIVSTNIEDVEFSKADTFSYVRMVDVWGLVAFYCSLIYPNGYGTRIPCTADNECVNTDAVYMDILDIIRVDRSKLNEEQIEWMSNPGKKRSLKEITDYQARWNDSASTTITMPDDDIDAGTITYTVPTCAEYVAGGEIWIEEIIEKVDGMISERTTLARKDQLLEEHYRLSICREYSHTVKSITFPARDLGDGTVRAERLIEDPVTINVLLAEYSTNPVFHKQILGSINEYLDRRTVTHVGVPPHKCSACKCMSTRPVGNVSTLIPLDPFVTFFILRNQKLQRSMLKSQQD